MQRSYSDDDKDFLKLYQNGMLIIIWYRAITRRKSSKIKLSDLDNTGYAQYL